MNNERQQGNSHEISVEKGKMLRFMDHPAVITMAIVGITDMAIQAMTSGEVKLIRWFLGIIFN